MVYAEGEDERVLRAVQIVVDEGLAKPILIGRPQVIEQRLRALRAAHAPGQGYRARQSGVRPALPRLLETYHKLTERQGRDAQITRSIEMRRTLDADRRDDDLQGRGRRHALRHVRARTRMHLHFIDQVIGLRAGVRDYAAMNAVMLPGRTVFICDTYVNPDPDAEQIAEMTLLAAEEMRRFGIVPKVALLSAVELRLAATAPAAKMREALRADRAARARARDRGRDARGRRALGGDPPARCSRNSRLRGEANLLIMPTLDAANISFNLLKTAAGGGVTVGPDPARRGAPGAHPHALGHGAAHRQHDGARGRRRERSARPGAAVLMTP